MISIDVCLVATKNKEMSTKCKKTVQTTIWTKKHSAWLLSRRRSFELHTSKDDMFQVLLLPFKFRENNIILIEIADFTTIMCHTLTKIGLKSELRQKYAYYNKISAIIYVHFLEQSNSFDWNPSQFDFSISFLYKYPRSYFYHVYEFLW